MIEHDFNSMKSFYVPLKYAAMPLIIALLSSGLFLFQDHSLSLLEFNRNAINNGEWWRILTGNLMHSNHWHLLLNLGGLLLATLLIGHLLSWRHFLALTISNGVMVSLLIYWFNPDTIYYVGLSGYLHGLFIYGALVGISQTYMLKRHLSHRSFTLTKTNKNGIDLMSKWHRHIKFDRETYLILFVGITAKIIYEQLFGASQEMKELINTDIATDAHMYGGAVAVVLFIKYRLYQQLKY